MFFSEVYTVDCQNNTNRELFASDNPDMIDTFYKNVTLEENADLVDMMNVVKADLEKLCSRRLSDDGRQSPRVELLGNAGD